jgi:Leucine-rich repeat (LRR) protein
LGRLFLKGSPSENHFCSEGGAIVVVERVADHPHWEDLQAYGQGRLDPDCASAVEDHLARCERCCQLVETAPTDSFLSRLREAGTLSAASSSGSSPAIPPELVNHPRYRVLGLIGEGGMGSVYRAEHRRMERLVALKVIRPGLMCHPDTVRRFHQEARAAARLHHANIVTAFDADQAGGLHFLVMEYVQGTNLAGRVRRHGPLPISAACTYVRQAALGLQHAHEQGMVHRDIKPHNLMIAESGRSAIVKILDFGLARLPRISEGVPAGSAASGPLTGVGTVMGTADYIAPEQAADPSTADIRADIYALGCTLFHLLTGRPPFPDGTVAEKLDRHASSPLPALNALRPEAPAELAAVLERMTAKVPADRYATPAEVAEALAPFCPTEGAHRRLARKRRRWLAAGLMLSAAGLLAGAVFLYRTTDRGEPVAPIDDKGKEPIVHELPNPKTEETADTAAQTIQKLRGRITRDEQMPGKPVVYINLAGSRLTDADMRAVAACKQLRSLELGRTAVSDAGLKHLTGLSHLTSLTLPGTHVTDAGMKYIGELKQLVALDLQLTPVGDTGMKHLAGLTQLRTLSLNGTRVTDAGMADVGRLTNLTFLRLDATAISDAGLESLTGLSKLDNLALVSVRSIGDKGMKSMARLKRLVSLDLRETHVTDEGLKELARCEKLASLRIGKLKITDAGVQSLAPLTRLKVLDLSSTEVTDEGVKDVAKHRRLTNLYLQNLRRVTDAGVKELAKLPTLQILALGGTGISDAGVKELAGLPQLKFLVLTNTAVTDAGLKELERCPLLMSLQLSGSKVTNAGAAELRKARPNLHIQR